MNAYEVVYMHCIVYMYTRIINPREMFNHININVLLLMKHSLLFYYLFNISKPYIINLIKIINSNIDIYITFKII